MLPAKGFLLKWGLLMANKLNMDIVDELEMVRSGLNSLSVIIGENPEVQAKEFSAYCCLLSEKFDSIDLDCVNPSLSS